MLSKNPMGTAVADTYAKNFPDTPSRSLGRKMYAENKTTFTSFDAAYSAIRYRRNAMGTFRNRKLSARGNIGVAPKSRCNPLNPLDLPQSDEKLLVPFIFDGAKTVLNISDLHIPYHNIPALTCALKDGKKHGCDGVLINGDLIDFHGLSKFIRDPSKRDPRGERKLVVHFLQRLRELFPKARIVFKTGNHDDRLWNFFAQRIPEIFNDERVNSALSLCNLLELDKFGIEYVTEKRKVMLGGLPVLHGHEFNNGFAPPVNPARGVYLKAKDCVMIGHHHVTSEHTETTLNRKIVTCWSVGCLCEVSPQYAPYNSWNHGHAIVEVKGSDFHVINKRQLHGVIL